MDAELVHWAAGAERRLAKADATDTDVPPASLASSAAASLAAAPAEACTRFPRLSMALALHSAVSDSDSTALLSTLCAPGGTQSLQSAARVPARFLNWPSLCKIHAIRRAVASIASCSSYRAASNCTAAVIAACCPDAPPIASSALRSADSAATHCVRALERARKASLCRSCCAALKPSGDSDGVIPAPLAVHSLRDWHTATRWTDADDARFDSLIQHQPEPNGAFMDNHNNHTPPQASSYRWLPDWSYLPPIQDALLLESLAHASASTSVSHAQRQEAVEEIVRSFQRRDEQAKELICFGIVSLIDSQAPAAYAESAMLRVCKGSSTAAAASVKALLEPHRNVQRSEIAINGVMSLEEARDGCKELGTKIVEMARRCLLENNGCSPQLERALCRMKSELLTTSMSLSATEMMVLSNPEYVAMLCSVCEADVIASAISNVLQKSPAWGHVTSNAVPALEAHKRALRYLQTDECNHELLMLSTLAHMQPQECLEDVFGSSWQIRLTSAAYAWASLFSAGRIVEDKERRQRYRAWAHYSVRKLQNEFETSAEMADAFTWLASCLPSGEEQRSIGLEPTHHGISNNVHVGGNAASESTHRDLNEMIRVLYLWEHDKAAISELLTLSEEFIQSGGSYESFVKSTSDDSLAVADILQGASRAKRAAMALKHASITDSDVDRLVVHCLYGVTEEVNTLITRLCTSDTTEVNFECAASLAAFIGNSGSTLIRILVEYANKISQCMDETLHLSLAAACTLNFASDEAARDGLDWLLKNPNEVSEAEWAGILAIRSGAFVDKHRISELTLSSQNTLRLFCSYLYFQTFAFEDGANDSFLCRSIKGAMSRSLAENEEVVASAESALDAAVILQPDDDVKRRAELARVSLEPLRSRSARHVAPKSLAVHLDSAAQPISLLHHRRPIYDYSGLDEVALALLCSSSGHTQMRAAHVVMLLAENHDPREVRYAFDRALQVIAKPALEHLPPAALHVILRLSWTKYLPPTFASALSEHNEHLSDESEIIGTSLGSTIWAA